ncbi:MAG: hypothetical protein QG611_119, partial [Bacteroidota bacterium]|nr:hypothetical protein [Bacteroidota bacterium]
MLRNLFVFISVAAAFATSGCIKETYDLDTFSEKAHLSPTFVISAVRGDISLSDLIEPNDTVFFDENDLLKIVFREDSVIDFRMEDYYDLNDMVSFDQTYPIGDLSIEPFMGTMNFTLDEISQQLSPAERALFVALNGTTNNLPPIPPANIGTKTYDAFLTFEYASFSEGSIDIFVKNNLPAIISGATIKLYNASDNTRIGSDGIIAPIAAGSTGTTSIDLAGQTVMQSVKAEIILDGSPGTSTPVLINLNDNLEITIAGRDMRVNSGRVILPIQTIVSLDNSDTVDFDPGEGIKIDLIKMNTGNISYSVVSGAPVTSHVELKLPTAKQGNDTITTSITIGPNATLPGTISVDNSEFNLGAVVSQPYNLLPVEYSIELSSTGNMVTFNSTDEIAINLELLDPDFDYVKGYFGKQTETLDNDTIDLDIKEILDHISGEFLISSPSITLNYKNSFALPVE